MKSDTKRKVAIGGLAAGGVALAWAVWPDTNPRKKFLKIASAEEGSLDWRKYLQGVTLQTPSEKKHWCGIFALWAMHQAGFACDWHWDLMTGKGFLYRLTITRDPQPGDMAYIHNFQHHAIVEKVEGNMIHTIDGNSGPQPTRVLRNVRPKSAFAAFYDTSAVWGMPC